MRIRLLDLFCGAGGASVGYSRVGFEMVGVDIEPQPRYPYEFHQADALEYVAEHWQEYDAIHASPPCQDHTTLKSRTKDRGTGWMLAGTLAALDSTGLPHVVENVMGATMPTRLILCGSMFGLAIVCRDGVKRQLRRHRRFASNVPLRPLRCMHGGQPIGVYGTGGGGQQTRGYRAYADEAGPAMGIDWMSRGELSQAIPPAYTEWIGEQLIEAIK